ncbi:DUF4214 domain-containing protein [Arhodomonas sp. SL1]|uniref:DUF4214 domain-containing protein n=1 Tax=Arhodomonas sp. SL1 TaxID=3425691 RepID=UPI003F883309
MFGDYPARGDTGDELVATLYVTLFGRAPGAEGFAYWRDQLAAGALPDAPALAQAMFDTPAARTQYPRGLSAEETVTRFYEHTLGRSPDSGGLAFWTDKLERAPDTGTVIAAMVEGVLSFDPGAVGDAELAAQGARSQALLGNRIAVAEHFAVEGPGTVEGAHAVVERVTPQTDTSSREAIAAFIDAALGGAEPTAALEASIAADPRLDGHRGMLEGLMEAAWGNWSRHFDADMADRSLEVGLAYDPRDDGTLAWAYTPLIGTGSNAVDGNTWMRTIAEHELITGEDANGASLDGTITVAEPLEEFLADPDFAETVLTHEMGHLIGILDTLDPFTSTAFEARSSDGFFHGERSGALALAPLPNGEWDGSHLAEGLMAPGLAPGGHAEVTATELDLLADIGLPMETEPYLLA